MDSSSVLSDDEYDLVSNPESSIADLRPYPVNELPPSSAAQGKFETVRWTALEIQARIGKALNAALERFNAGATLSNNVDNRTIRVYVDGAFDMFDVGNALQLRQAKLAFPYVYLLVGVFSDERLNEYGHSPSWTAAERYEIVRHCRWVDEVVVNAPWEVTESFMQQQRIDFVAIDEGTSVDPACDKARVKAYDEIKRLAKVIQTRRTSNLTFVKPCASASTAPGTPVIPTMLFAPGQDFIAHVQEQGKDS